MTIKLIEGFDLVGSNADLLNKSFVLAEGTWGASSGRFGGPGYSLPTSNATKLGKTLLYAKHITTSFWWKSGSTNSKRLIACYSLSNPDSSSATYLHGLVDVASNGSVSLYRDGQSIKATSDAGIIQINTWHHIEVCMEIAAAGTWSVYIDGILVVTATGDFIDILYTYTSIVFYGDSGVNILDDIVVQTDSSSQPLTIGEHKIHTLLPSADTTQADWTGSYTDVDDPAGSSDGDTTYISTTTLNNKSEFDLGNLPESPTTIHAVQSLIEARKTDAGTKGVTHYIDSNGTRENGTEFGAAEAYSSHTKIHEQNPNGSIAWTESAINALKIGVEITT